MYGMHRWNEFGNGNRSPGAFYSEEVLGCCICTLLVLYPQLFNAAKLHGLWVLLQCRLVQIIPIPVICKQRSAHK